MSEDNHSRCDSGPKMCRACLSASLQRIAQRLEREMPEVPSYLDGLPNGAGIALAEAAVDIRLILGEQTTKSVLDYLKGVGRC